MHAPRLPVFEESPCGRIELSEWMTPYQVQAFDLRNRRTAPPAIPSRARLDPYYYRPGSDLILERARHSV